MAFLGFQDLARRWVYTPRGARKVIASRDFPAPAFTINAGRTKVWTMADVNGYETNHPELTSEEAKRRKRAGYAAALARGRKEGGSHGDRVSP